MSSERSDLTIAGSQLVTRGTRLTLSWDLEEIDAQDFTIDSGTVAFHQADGTEVVVAQPLGITVGLMSKIRVQITLEPAETSAIPVGYGYALITLVMGDNQTRIGKAAIRARDGE